MIRHLSVSLLLATFASGQITSFSLPAPAISQVTSGGQTVTSTLQPATLASFGTTGESLGGSFVNVSWDDFAAPTGVYFNLHNTAFCTAGATANFGGADFLYELSTPTSITAELQLRRIGDLSNVTWMVDVGDDGTIELSHTSPSDLVTLQITLGPTPLTIRIHNAIAQTTAGATNSRLAITTVPTANIQMTPAVLGCDTSHRQFAQTTFDSEIQLGVIGPLHTTQPSVMLLGTSLQPFLLPSSTTFPCLLLPSPDVALFPGQQFINLQAPPSVRPFSFWVQSVVLHPTELRTTDAIFVNGV